MIPSPAPLCHSLNMSSSTATSVPRSIPRSAVQDLLVALVNLSPVEYDHLQNGLQNNYSLLRPDL